jgi:hypothetical protein
VRDLVAVDDARYAITRVGNVDPIDAMGYARQRLQRVEGGHDGWAGAERPPVDDGANGELKALSGPLLRVQCERVSRVGIEQLAGAAVEEHLVGGQRRDR